MPVFRPKITNKSGKVYDRRKKWGARRRRNWQEYWLGYYPTREEAEEVEREFDMYWPRGS